MVRMSSRRHSILGAGFVMLAIGAGGARPNVAMAAGASDQAIGVWDLKLEGGLRQCRLQLRPEAALSGYAVAMPPGCHRAFPILNAVAIWTDPGEGKLQFDDNRGQPILAFETGGDGILKSTSPQGEIYRLEPVGAHKALPAAKPAPPAAKVAEAPTSAPAAEVPKAAAMGGYYAVLREKTRDTGCMVTFDDKVRGPKSSLKAHLAPACRDQGIVIFDPVGWQLAGTQLILTARKGHTAKFEFQQDGTWLKDPLEGKSLSLKKM